MDIAYIFLYRHYNRVFRSNLLNISIAAHIHNFNLYGLTMACVGECVYATSFAHNTPTRVTIAILLIVYQCEFLSVYMIRFMICNV